MGPGYAIICRAISLATSGDHRFLLFSKTTHCAHRLWGAAQYEKTPQHFCGTTTMPAAITSSTVT